MVGPGVYVPPSMFLAVFKDFYVLHNYYLASECALRNHSTICVIWGNRH